MRDPVRRRIPRRTDGGPARRGPDADRRAAGTGTQARHGTRPDTSLDRVLTHTAPHGPRTAGRPGRRAWLPGGADDPTALGPGRQPQTPRRPWRQAAAFDRDAYRRRNTVERCINKLKQWRGLATRYDKTATIYLAGLDLAALFIWSER
ncbi:transposase [Streptomyces sp. ISID311]|nr:transposase [Streptomyces sp. ISID311]